MSRSQIAVRAIIPGFLLLAACQTRILDNTPPSAVAYVAPATLNLRASVAQKDSVVAVLRHGERVQVLESRRRFVKIQSVKGLTGWVDALQLLTPDRMAQIQAEARRAADLPSEGAATAFEETNAHLEPNRQSPAFARVPEGGSVQVLGHKVSPRSSAPPKPPVFDIPKPVAARKSRRASETKNAFPFPHPAPPKPPAESLQSPAPAPQPAPAAPEGPAVLEDWSLVRLNDKQTGWVLSRNLSMSIPDEVAQYAEGKHITSYFDLGTVNDEAKGVKHNWLWTTSSELESCDFDGWRVFLWNRRHHRYETSYRAHALEGYFPVSVDPGEAGSLARTFHLILKESDGKLWVHTYTFDGVLVRSASMVPYGTAGSGASQGLAGTSEGKPASSGWIASRWNKLMQKFKRK